MVALALVVSFLYRHALAWLGTIWWQDKEYSHGFLIPLVSAYFIWRKRRHIASTRVEPDPRLGGALVLASVLLVLGGRAGGIILAEAVSFLVLLPGIALLVWGKERVRALGMPLFYLQFMVPWHEVLIERIHGPFQRLSAITGVALLKAVGVPAFLEGRFIYLPNIALEVAKECSGVGFLLSVLALGLPLVYVTQTRWSRAAGVLTGGLGLTVLTNGLRVALVGATANKYGPGLLHGPHHVLQGWFTAQVGFLFLFLVNWLVARRSGSGEKILCDRWKEAIASQENLPEQDHRGTAYLIAACVLLAVAALAYANISFSRVPLPAGALRLAEPNGWKGKDVMWFDGRRYFPGSDFEVAREYKKPGGRTLYCYVGYFAVQAAGKSVISYHARPLYEEATEIATGLDRGPDKVVRSRFSEGGQSYEVFLWHKVRSRNLTGRYAIRFWTVAESLLHSKNNGAVFIIAVPSGSCRWEDVKTFIEFLGSAAREWVR